MEHLDAKGAMVVVESEDSCMKIRDVNKRFSVMVTSGVRGTFKTDAAARAEPMALLSQHR